MKKFLVTFLVGVFLVFGLNSQSFAATFKYIQVSNAIKTIQIDGKVASTDKVPFVYNDTTYVPLRFVSESLGYDVKWDKETSSVKIGKGIGTDQTTKKSSGNTKVENTTYFRNIYVSDAIKTIYINNKEAKTDKQPIVYENTTYVPLRFISESLGYDVKWDRSTQSVKIGVGIGSDQQSQQPQQSQTPSTQVSTEVSAMEQEVVRLVNEERAKVGLGALKINTELSKVAREKSRDMQVNKYFSHQSPTYGSPFDMMKQFGIKYSYAGENIAMGQQTAASVVKAWMNSQGHKENILNKNYTEIGVGLDKNGYYWTQMFIRP